ncbi:MAG: hypothetical protein JF599_12630 [Verrucomicrobia bacterium]|nr:hypothetical protein [Verrucomicrobiota bacterium]
MDTLKPLFSSAFLFRDQPVSVPADLRPIWRLSLLMLLLNRCCKQGKASLQKLHVLNWALRTPESRQAMLEALDGLVKPDSALVRFDPALNKTLDLARGEDLVEQLDGPRYQITAKGLAIAEELAKDQTAFQVEQNFLETIGSRLTESFVAKMM